MRQLGLFARHWQAGKVKTRLASVIGNERAACFHYESLSTLLARFSSAGDCRTVVFTPNDERAAFIELAGGAWELEPQGPGDLGTRMRGFFDRRFRSRDGLVVVIGSDSPTLPQTYVEAAFETLRQVPVVLGPAEDGGYYLVGAACPIPFLFENIAWGQPTVFAQTIERLSAAGMAHRALPVWYDVDRWEDLMRLNEELNALSNSPLEFHRLQRWVRDTCRQILPTGRQSTVDSQPIE